MANVPIPREPIGENFAWRDWFQKLGNRVFGSMGTQSSSNVAITGGSIDGTIIGHTDPASGRFTSLAADSATFTSLSSPTVNAGNLSASAVVANSLEVTSLTGFVYADGTSPATAVVGWTGTFQTNDTPARTATVVNGLITNVA